MYAVLPCGGIGVRFSLSSWSACVSVSPGLNCVLPPAGGQRHSVEWDALIGCSAHGGGLGYRAGLQSGCRGVKSKAFTEATTNHECELMLRARPPHSVLVSLEWLRSCSSSRAPCWGVHGYVSTPVTEFWLHFSHYISSLTNMFF